MRVLPSNADNYPTDGGRLKSRLDRVWDAMRWQSFGAEGILRERSRGAMALGHAAMVVLCAITGWMIAL
jgi:hypothetical protein